MIEENDIEVAMQLAVLKTIVEQMRRIRSSAGVIFLRLQAGGKPLFTYDYRTTQFPCDQERLVAELLRSTVRIYGQHSASGASVSTREDINPNASRGEEFAEHDDEGRLARAADGDVAHAHYRPGKLSRS